VAVCMKTIVPEALSFSGAPACTYPDQSSGQTGQHQTPKKQPAGPKCCGL